MHLQVHAHTSTLDADDLKEFMELLTVDNGASLKNLVGSKSLTEEQMVTFTGLRYDQLGELAATLKTARNSRVRSVFEALVIFLFKLRTGTSNRTIAAIFGLQDHQQVSDIMESVLNSFEKDVLPHKFGYAACVREDLIERETSPFVRTLFGTNALALIYYGTYLRHGKSSNNAYQRKTYSGQKHGHLVKPFTICTTTGYIVNMLTPAVGTMLKS